LPLLQKAIKANKLFRLAYVELGAIYVAQKNYKEAEPALLEAIKLDPSEPDAHYQLGRLYQAEGKTADAKRELDKVRELHEKKDEGLSGKMPSATPAVKEQ
jgi:tetratricopeptide (TPR) repeat protein